MCRCAGEVAENGNPQATKPDQTRTLGKWGEEPNPYSTCLTQQAWHHFFDLVILTEGVLMLRLQRFVRLQIGVSVSARVSFLT